MPLASRDDMVKSSSSLAHTRLASCCKAVSTGGKIAWCAPCGHQRKFVVSVGISLSIILHCLQTACSSIGCLGAAECVGLCSEAGLHCTARSNKRASCQACPHPCSCIASTPGRLISSYGFARQIARIRLPASKRCCSSRWSLGALTSPSARSS